MANGASVDIAFYQADSPLLTSGLMGPVKIVERRQWHFT
jgi:hypothetical protein